MRTDAEPLILQELQRVSSYLCELVSYQRRKDLSDALVGDTEKRKAYELSDGSRSSKEVREEGDISVSARTVQRWWQDWVDKGLAERLDGGSIRARYDPRVLDADIKED